MIWGETSLFLVQHPNQGPKNCCIRSQKPSRAVNSQVPEAFCDNNRRGGTVEQEDDIEVEQLVDVAKDKSYKVGP